MVIKKRYKIQIPSEAAFELDLKRLCYRMGIEDERVAIKAAVHMCANMRVADFDTFVKAYTGKVNEYARIKIPEKFSVNRIDRLEGLNMLKTYKVLGYTLAEVELETGIRMYEISKYLWKRGLTWGKLKYV